MTVLPPLPDSLAEEAGFLTSHETRQLWEAAVLMADSRGLLVRLTAMFGRQIEGVQTAVLHAGEKFGGKSWTNAVQKAQDAVEDILWNSYSYATFGLDAAPGFLRPKQPRKNLMHRLAATASGAVSGFAGLPGAVVDIPFTTATILRSIAEVARDSGEDLSSEETRRACLEVLAFGVPGDNGEQTESGYWAARLGASHLTINLLIHSAANRFGLILAEKTMAQIVPVAGAVTGGLLNYSFTDYYQSMAKVHFCLRALERRTGEPEAVKRYFQVMLRAARERRRLGRGKRQKPPVLLPAG